ncbi:MAG: MBG domain-containing protein [Marinoscillum sp.]|uniref:MBG domain-containing protein n=1 Tax=Marinoscillum sp. TaxID=2024838 RepID=UPI0032F1C6F9
MKNFLTILFLTSVMVTHAQNVTIPDANFKAAILAHSPTIDTNGDNELQVSEAEAFTGELNVFNKSIGDLTGIEAFVNLTKLNCGVNQLTALDVTANTALTRLHCHNNQLTSLDVTQNTLLDTLFIANNQISAIDLSENTSLIFLYFVGNNIASIDLSHLTGSLKLLGYGDNPLSASFDFTSFTALTHLYCNDSELTSLDVSGLTDLQYLYCQNNNLTSLNAKNGTGSIVVLYTLNNPSLSCIQVDDPAMDGVTLYVDPGVTFDGNCADPVVSLPDAALKAALLTYTPDIDTNDDGEIRQSEALAVTGALDLSGLGISTALGLEAFGNLTSLNLSDNSISVLNLSENAALTSVNVANNELIILSVANGNNTNFVSFDATGNDNLTCITVDDPTYSTSNWTDIPAGASFDASCALNIPDTNFKNALLAHNPVIDSNSDGEIQVSEAASFSGALELSYKSITNLAGLEGFGSISTLSINGNTVSELDLSFHPFISQFSAEYCGLTTLDVSQNAYLKYLYISNNSLTTLDLSNNFQLTTFYVYSNDLTGLDLTQNDNLSTLYCQGNELVALSLSTEGNLVVLDYGSNPLTGAFDFTPYTSLVTLGCGGGGLTALDVSMLPELRSLSCYNNSLAELDLSANPKMTTLSAFNNELTTFDPTGLPLLSQLNLGDNLLTTLDLSNSPALQTVQLPNNSLSSLDFSNGNALNYLDCRNNELTSLNINVGKNVNYLNATGNVGLTCISVYDLDFAADYVNVPAGVGYDRNCDDPSIDVVDPKLLEALLSYEPAIDLNANQIIETSEAAAFTGTLDLSDKGIRNAAGLEAFSGIDALILDDNDFLRLDLSGNSALESLSAQNVGLTILKLNNGNNENFTTLNLSGNPDLLCINVDDPAYAESNWTGIPEGVGFSMDCAVNFEDESFKNHAIFKGYDLNDDAEIQLSEAEAVTGKLTDGYSHSSIGGIEAFQNITELDINSTYPLFTVDLTANHGLVKFYAANGYLSSLDLSMNPNLTHIDLDGARMTFLDLRNGNNSKITVFEARNIGYIDQNLTCVNVDDVDYFYDNFSDMVDEEVFFDTNCEDPLVVIPDANFKSALLSIIEDNGDGEVRMSEAEAFEATIDVSGEDIASLEGIQYFINAIGLAADNNLLTAIDVRRNSALISFSAANNSLTALDVANQNNENFTVFNVTGNPDLTCIKVDDPTYAEANWTNVDPGVGFATYCDPDDVVYIPDYYMHYSLYGADTNSSGDITYAEAEAYTGLVTIHSNTEDVTGLEAFTNITGIRYSGSLIESFDFSPNQALTEINIYGSHDVQSVDFSENVNLEVLSLSNIELGGVDLTTYPELNRLYLRNCGIASIDLSPCLNLEYLNLSDNSLTGIDLSANTSLIYLYLESNPITSIDLSTNTLLTELDLSGTDITTLDVSHLTLLEDLRLEGAKSLTSLDVSQNELLYILYASANGLEEGDPAPEDRGSLTQVWLPKGDELSDVALDFHLLESIDLSGMTNESLDVGLRGNRLKSVDFSGVTGSSFYVDLSLNDLDSIDLSEITGVDAFVYLDENPLKKVTLGSVYEVSLVDNPDLYCALVDDVAYAEANYSYDEQLTFTTVACENFEAEILSFDLPFQEGDEVIDGEGETIMVSVEDGTDVTSLEPIIELPEGATVSPLGAQDFTNPVLYTVTSESGFFTQSYTVYVTVKSLQTISFEAIADKTYGDAPFEITVSASSGLPVELTFVTGEDLISISESEITVLGAGPVTIQADQAGDSEYAAAVSVQRSFEITPAVLTVTAADASITYGEAIPTLEYAVTGFVNGEDETVLSGAPGISTPATAESGAGNYAIELSEGAADNYTFVLEEAVLTIAKADLMISALDHEMNYGEAVSDLAYEITGFVTDEDETNLTTLPILTTGASAASDVGIYTVNVSGAASDNYNLTYQSAVLTIQKALLTVTADDQTIPYGSDLPELTYEITGFANNQDESVFTSQVVINTTATSTSPVGSYDIMISGAEATNYEFEFFNSTLTIEKLDQIISFDDLSDVVYGAVPLVLSASSTSGHDVEFSLVSGPVAMDGNELTITGVGSVVIEATVEADDIYHAATTVSRTFEITPATLTVTAENELMVYGEDLPELTYEITGFVYGEDESVLTANPEILTTAVEGSPVGEYEITVSSGAASNYAFVYEAATLEVMPAELTVSPDDHSIIYGESLPTLTYEMAGFVNGEDASAMGTLPVITSTAVEGSGAGTYDITGSDAQADNYTFVYLTGSLTIGKASLQITADSKSITYGDALPTLTYTISGFVHGEDESDLEMLPVMTTAAQETTGAGTYDITGSGALSENYTFAYHSGSLIIGKANLQISAHNKSITYGDAIPALTYAITGFVHGDDESDLAISPVLSTIATGTSDAGAYTIKVEGAASPDYEISYEHAVLTIGKAEAMITLSDLEVGYSGAPQSPTVTTTPEGLNYIIEFASGSEPSEAGAYDFKVVIEETNYKGNAEGVFKISRPLSSLNDVQVEIYPNPVSERLFLKGLDQEADISIMALDGRIVHRQKAQHMVEVSQLSGGVYMVVVQTPTGKVQRRIIID